MASNPQVLSVKSYARGARLRVQGRSVTKDVMCLGRVWLAVPWGT